MNQYMQAAFNEARVGMRGGKGGPFGASVVKGGKIISVASNEVLAAGDPTAHAEIVAIRRACQKLHTHDLSGCTLYSTGEPCPMCLSAIVWANIKKAYYACPACDAAKIGFRDSMIYSHIRGEKQILRVQKLDCGAVSSLYDEYRAMGSVIY